MTLHEAHGKDWKKISTLMKTRTVVQVKTHAQKHVREPQVHLRSLGGGGEGAAAGSTAAKKKKAENRRVSGHRCGVRGGKRRGG